MQFQQTVPPEAAEPFYLLFCKGLTHVVTAVWYKEVKGNAESESGSCITGNTVFTTASVYSISFCLRDHWRTEKMNPPGVEIPSEEPNGVPR